MKTKLCWIPFIPIALVMIVLKYIEATLPAGETFMGLDSLGLIYTVIILVPVVLILCLIISLFDKKISPYYALSKNFAAAIFVFIAGVAVIFTGVMSIMDTVSTGSVSAFDLITSIVGTVAGIGLLFMASAHLSGKSCSNSVSVLIIFPSVWAAFKLVHAFLTYRTVSVLSADMLDLLCYGIITLFFCADAMMLGNIESKNSVKRCFIFGFTLMAAVFAYCTKEIISVFGNFEAYEISDVADVILMLSIGLYTLSVLIELSLKAKTKDEVVLLNGDEAQLGEQTTVREKVDFLDDEPEESEIESGSFISTVEAEMKSDAQEKQAEIKPEPGENTEEEAPASKADVADNGEALGESDFVFAPKQEKSDELQNRMDEIDKLIFDIQSKHGE